jgi:uridine kinase
VKSNEEISQKDTAGILNSLLGKTMINNTLLKEVEKLQTTPILIVEGIIVLNDPQICSMCDLKFFITIDKDFCWNRRKNRVWDPEGSCWEESPGYFEDIAWPEYVKCVGELKDLESDEIEFLDSNKTSIEENFTTVLTDIINKLKLSS